MFRLVSAPTIFPARSLIGNTAGPMVDTEVILQKGGRVYLTETEGWEVVNKFATFADQLGLRAESLGWLSPADTAAKDARIAALEQRLDELEQGAPKFVSLDDALELVRGAPA
jgi:hypothetical protein